MEWSDRVRSLLWDGETIQERFDLEGGDLVVTSHRVLAFEPDGDGANYRRVDRPNVEGVAIDGGGEWSALRRAATFGLAGGALLGVAATVSFESFLSSVDPVGTDGGAGAGTGGVEAATGALDSVRRLLSLLDALVLVVGLLLAAVAVGFLGWYLRSRRRYLRVAVGGQADLEIPVANPDEDLAERLEAAIRPDPAPGGTDGSDAGFGAEASAEDAASGGPDGR